MFLKAKKAMIVFGLINVIISVGVAQEPPKADASVAGYRDLVRMKGLDLQKFQERLDEVKAELDKCTQTIRGDYECKGWGNPNKTDNEIKRLQAEQKSLAKTVGLLAGQISDYNRKIKVTDSIGKGDAQDVLFDAKYLLMNAAALKADTSATDARMRQIMTSMNNTILGAYVKYAAEQTLKTKDGKKAICEAAAACGTPQPTAKSRKEEIMSLPAFRKANEAGDTVAPDLTDPNAAAK